MHIDPLLKQKGADFKVNEDVFKIRRKELNKLKNMYKNMPKDKLKINEDLMKRAVFMQEKLAEMEQRIDSDGLLVTMSQGNYSIDRAHPLISQYNAMVKNYTTIIKQLNEVVPAADADRAGEALLQFAIKKPKGKQ